MPENKDYAIPGMDEAVNEVAKDMAGSPEVAKEPIETITIKFGKGLVGEPFTAKSGKEFVEVLIPNSDAEDKRPWRTFVLEAKDVHVNKFGKGLWAKIPANGYTTVQRSVLTGEVNGVKQWGSEKETVTNAELKKLVEYYKERPRNSVRSQLDANKETAAKENAGRAAGRTLSSNEELPFPGSR